VGTARQVGIIERRRAAKVGSGATSEALHPPLDVARAHAAGSVFVVVAVVVVVIVPLIVVNS